MATLPVAIDARQAKKGAVEFERSTEKVSKAAGEMAKKTESSGRKIKRISAETARSVNKSNNSMKRSFSTVNKALGGFVTAFTVFTALSVGVRTLSSFETTMSSVRAVAIDTTQSLALQERQFTKLNSAARQLGATTRFTAAEAGEGLLFLARAGFSVENALESLPHTLNLAAAGAVELGDAADIASNVLSQFGLSAEETERAVDVLLKTTNSSNTNVRQLAEGMKLVGPVAGGLGVSLEETAAAMGVLGDSGIQATLAGTNLRGMFAGLLSETPKSARALAKMGLTMEDVSLQTQELPDLLDKLRTGLLRIQSETERSTALFALFGRRNVAAAISLTNNTLKVRALTEALRDGSGTAKTAAAIMNDNLAGSAKAFSSALQELVLQGGDGGARGMLRSFIDTGTSTVRILNDTATATDRASVGARTLAPAIRATAIGFGAVAIVKAPSIFKAIGTAVIGIASKLNPIVLVVTALASLTTFFVSLKSDARGAAHELDRVGKALNALKDTSLEIEYSTGRVNSFLKLGDLTKAEQEVRGMVNIYKEAFAALDAVEGDFVKSSKLQEILGNKGLSDLVQNSALSVEEQGIAFLSGMAGPTMLSSQIFPKDKALGEIQKRIESLKKQALGISNEKNIKIGLPEEKKAGSKEFSNEYLDGLVKELDLIGKVGIERTVAVESKRIEAELDKLGVKNKEAIVQVLTQEFRKKEELKALFVDEKQLKEQALEATNVETENRREGVFVLEQMLQSMNDEVKIMGVSVGQREALRMQLESERVIRESGIEVGTKEFELSQKLIGQLSDRAKGLQELASVESADKNLMQLNQELELLKLTGEARSKRAFIFQQSFQLEQLGIGQGTEKFSQYMSKLGIVFDKLRKVSKLDSVANGISNAFGTAFDKVAAKAKLTSDIVKSFLLDVQRSLVRDLVSDPFRDLMKSGIKSLAGLLGGGGQPAEPNALGNVFSGGQVVPFASGAIFTSPAMFPIAGGRTGVLGEAGPESVMPLDRGPDGKLGIKNYGGGSKSMVVNVNVYANNPSEFKGSERQMARRVGSALRGYR